MTKPPTARQIDALKARIDRADKASRPTAKQQAAAKLASELRAQALGLALQFGEVPSSAPASKRVHGAEWQFTATGGTITSDHPEAIVELREAMREHKHEALFAQMFTPSTRYDRAKDAANNFALAVLPQKLRDLFTPIFARTQSETSRKPSLRIDPVK